jgi:hypothetical protein
VHSTYTDKETGASSHVRKKYNWDPKNKSDFKFVTIAGQERLIPHPIKLPINPLKSNDLKRRRAVSPLKIKIPNKNKHEKPTNTPIIHSVY